MCYVVDNFPIQYLMFLYKIRTVGILSIMFTVGQKIMSGSPRLIKSVTSCKENVHTIV